MNTAELRQTFIDFFAERGHQVVRSSSLVPGDDPTLLFTNAGMVQFKDVFLGKEKRSYTRAVSSQRVVRAGGKHNDLENVGYTARHHTFFEMLGNFSFGDYFKRDAIEYAWELLTTTLALPPERLWVTVYRDDDEAADIWLKHIGVDSARFSRMGEKDNFWSMGDTGPCGPCTEVFYDHGPDVPGGPPGSPGEDGDRYVEIWNLVFMQYDRAADGTLSDLPRPSVDTGMGLERAAAVLQGVHSNYDIDLFRRLIDAAAEVTSAADRDSNSLKVIADHIRACAFLITDGVTPSNADRGYVLRRIIRRALRHGHRLGCSEPFFHKLVAPLDREMGDAFPELRERRNVVEQAILGEERAFAKTLDNGMHVLERELAAMSGGRVAGDVAFKLYDTYGFPVDMTADIAREHGKTVDLEGFEAAMAEQRRRGREEGRFGADHSGRITVDAVTEFTGYEQVSDTGRVVALFREGQAVEELGAGDQGIVVLDRTPFYAESGGQVGDTGTLAAGAARFDVKDTQKLGTAFGHVGSLAAGALRIGDTVQAGIDVERRQRTVRNHSATHLLHAALREVLGEHVNQQGSLVAPDRLRFDFSHDKPLDPQQLARIESLVNREIRRNAAAETRTMPIEEAKAAGAMALFGEKYDDEVRVLRLGDYSIELCGGTHVGRTGDIGLFKIVSQSSVAAGTRRVEALTGDAALAWIDTEEQRLTRLQGMLNIARDGVEEKVGQLLERNRTLEKELQKLKAQLLSAGPTDPTTQAVEVDGIKVLAMRVEESDPKMLRDAIDRFRDRLGQAVVVLGASDGEKVRLIAGVSKALTARVKAGELIGSLAARVGGSGGGRPDMAQAGGNDPSQLDAALASVPDLVRERLAS